MSDYLYRVVVTSYPDGALIDYEVDGETFAELDRDWAPAGWVPEGRYVEIMGTDKFVWPVTTKEYKSRSSAKARADLLRRYGAECVIQRSSRITWPDDQPPRVPLTPEQAVAAAFELVREALVNARADGGEA